MPSARRNDCFQWGAEAAGNTSCPSGFPKRDVRGLIIASYSEQTYFEGGHFAHIVAREESDRFQRISLEMKEAAGLRSRSYLQYCRAPSALIVSARR